MASLKDDNVNFDKLETGVYNAMEAENLYWLQNDAKFRAVKQKGSYDEFKEIVAAAHLKPLAKNDKIQLEEKIVSPWNSSAAKVAPASSTTVSTQSTTDTSKTKLPTSSNEFILAWRKVKGPEARAEYLNSLLMTKGGSLHLATIFKHEIPFALLGEFIKSMENKIELFDDAVIADFLQSLSHTGRFDLSLTFLGSDEKQSLNSILNHLEKSGTDTSDLKFRYAM